MTATATSPVVIVGAGPCGIAAGVALTERGIPSLLIEKGCLVSSIESYPTKLTMFSTPEKLTIGDVPFPCAGMRPTRQETIDYYRAVAKRYELDVHEFERVTAVERSAAGFRLAIRSETNARGSGGNGGNGGAGREGGGSRTHDAHAIVVATGYFEYPNMLGVPGEDLPHVSHRFVDGDNARDCDVVVVGGGNSAVECAMELARCGARPTIVHYEPAFVSHVIKPWILPDFEAQVASGQIELRWNSRVTGIDTTHARITADGVTDRLKADLVYLMTGYTPRPGLLGALGVPFDDETGIPVHDPETMETSVPGVFVAGVLTSGKKANGVFIENGRGHGALIAAELARRPGV